MLDDPPSHERTGRGTESEADRQGKVTRALGRSNRTSRSNGNGSERGSRPGGSAADSAAVPAPGVADRGGLNQGRTALEEHG